MESKIHKSLELQEALIGHLIHSNDNPRQMTIYPIFKSLQVSNFPRCFILLYNPVMWFGGTITRLLFALPNAFFPQVI